MSSLPPIQRQDTDLVPQMPPAPDLSDLDAVIPYLERGLNCILLEPTWGADVSSLVGLYSAVHSFCTSQKAVDQEPGEGSAHRGAHLLGGDLYDFLTRYISRYLGQLRQRFQTLSGPTLVKVYLDEWTHFTNCAHIVHHVFRYLNRHWVKRERDEGKIVYDVYTLHLFLWHSELLQPIADELAGAVTKLVEQRRSGERVEGSTTRALIDFLVSLELDATDPSRPILEVYRSILELPIRKAIEAFIEAALPAIFCETWVAETLQEKLSRLEVEQRLIVIFFGPGNFQELSDSLTAPAMVKLVSKDLAVFEVEQRVAEHSFLIKNLCAFFGRRIMSRQYIPLPSVDADTLSKVLEWCYHHKDDPMTADNDLSGWNQRFLLASEATLTEWDERFFQVDQESLFEIILAANYLDIKPLLDLGCQTVANMIKGKTPEEIRRMFNITNDFTPEEEEQIRRENEWAEDY